MQSRGEHPEHPNKVNCAARFLKPSTGTLLLVLSYY
jgi:hypothetical protein